MYELLSKPWPWYISGPLIGLMVPILLIFGNKSFGISSSLRHICAACFPGNIEYFNYNWKQEAWNLFFISGIVIGGFLAHQLFIPVEKVDISAQTVEQLSALGVSDFSHYLPTDIFNWKNLFTAQGVLFVMVGGFFVGFGTRYANGCTSGHSITGLANLQWSSLLATIGFFIGGLVMTHLILPVFMH